MILERQINLPNPADKISNALCQCSLTSGLSGGLRFLVRRFRFDDIFRLHSFQKEAQDTTGKDRNRRERRIGGDFPDLFQNTFVLFGQVMPCEGKGGARSS